MDAREMEDEVRGRIRRRDGAYHGVSVRAWDSEEEPKNKTAPKAGGIGADLCVCKFNPNVIGKHKVWDDAEIQ
jgi:hypothetical protein